MISATWRMVRSVPKRMRSFVDWIDDPYVGDKISTPFQRDIATGAVSLILIPAHKLISVLKDYGYDQIFGVFSYAADFVTGTVWGYSGSGYNYRRLIWSGIVAGVKAGFWGLVALFAFLFGLVLGLLKKIGSTIWKRL